MDSAALASASKPLASGQKNRVRLTAAVRSVDASCKISADTLERIARAEAGPRRRATNCWGSHHKRQPRRHRQGAVAQHACLRDSRGSPAAPRRCPARGPGEHHVPKHLAPRPAITRLQPQHVLIKGHRRHPAFGEYGLLYWKKRLRFKTPHSNAWGSDVARSTK